jgi:hypothetical protein
VEVKEVGMEIHGREKMGGNVVKMEVNVVKFGVNVVKMLWIWLK